MENLFYKFDRYFISEMHRWGIPLLRNMLGIVFLWFGTLKLTGISPVAELIARTYSFFPPETFISILGIWEVLIGMGLILKISLRTTLALLWLQLAGTFIASLLEPTVFFSGNNPLFLTVEGEFVVKNLVLLAAGLVIGGHEVLPPDKQND